MRPLLALLLALPLAVSAEPFVQKDEAEIVQRLPYRIDAAERQRRAALARDPTQLPLAAATARAALQRASAHGDPRRQRIEAVRAGANRREISRSTTAAIFGLQNGEPCSVDGLGGRRHVERRLRDRPR